MESEAEFREANNVTLFVSGVEGSLGWPFGIRKVSSLVNFAFIRVGFDSNFVVDSSLCVETFKGTPLLFPSVVRIRDGHKGLPSAALSNASNGNAEKKVYPHFIVVRRLSAG